MDESEKTPPKKKEKLNWDDNIDDAWFNDDVTF